MIYSSNHSPRRLCEAIEPLIPVADGERIVRRPFNHYEPSTTNWWIVPSLDLPFFRFAKFYFCWDPEKRDTLDCGLYLAKGLDPLLRSVYPTKKGKRLLMDDTWGWHSWFSAVDSGEFRELIRESATAMGHEIEVIFEGGYVDDPGLFNPDSELRKRDRYRLVYNPVDDSIKVGGARRDAMSLKFLNKVRDWKSFEEQMRYLNAEQFMWCDVFVMNRYAIVPGEVFPAGAVIREPDAVWNEWLRFWRKFVK